MFTQAPNCFDAIEVRHHKVDNNHVGCQPGCTDDAIDALAGIAVDLNATVENIGARRLQTVMERVLDEISYTAPDRDGEDMVIDAPYVHANVGDLAKNTDLSRYIL